VTNHDNVVAGRWIRRGGIAALAAGALALTGALAPVSADPGPGQHGRFTRVDIDSHGDKLTFTPASQSNRLVNVMLQLQGQPVTVQQAAAQQRGRSLSKASQRSIRSELKSRQDSLTPAIRRAGGRVVAQLQTAYNGVQVQVREKDVAGLAELPGVVAVHKVRSFKPSNTNGVPFIGGPEAWGDYGKTGKGVKIAIIDTGIDYTHKDFGGAGTDAAWKYAEAHSTVDPSTDPQLAAQFGPDAPKVKGGWDLVGDAYNANDPASVPKPDANPLDCNGHGSHVAGSSAGFGVLQDGSTFHGPWNADTVRSHDWNVGPGVAPEAELYAFRVFGCEGSTDVTAEAIDRAAAAGVDVISMSLGSDFGGTDDPTTVAADNAAKAGITVVAASGNAGQNAYMTSSPASADHVLSVAALDGSQRTYPGADLSFDQTAGTVSTIVANGAALPTAKLPVKVLRNADGSIALGCDQSDYAGTAGALVVTKRGTCARVARAVYGQKAGAAAVLMVNSDGSLPPYEGPITSNPDTGEAYKVTIPFLGAAGTSANVQTLLQADGDQVTLTPTQIANTGYSKSASFTSAGPRNPDSAPKPEVIAPGVSVASVGMGTGDGFAIESGTSMATPMTSGAAALVKQAHPHWTGDQVKAALQNTADPSLNGDYDVRVAGTGAVQVQKAIDSTVLAQTADGLNSLAFGFVPGTGSYQATRTFTLTNTGTRTATYDLSVEEHGDQLGAEVKLPTAIVQVPAGQSVSVPVQLSMSAQAFAKLLSDDTYETGVGKVQYLGGDIVASPEAPAAGQQTLRTAYLMVPRGLSEVQAGNPSAFTPTRGGSTFGATLPVSNRGVHDGSADVYAWGITDRKDTGGAGMDVRDVGVQDLPGEALGAGHDDRGLVFAVNNWGSSTNQSVNEFDVAIDNNRDGEPDYFVVGIDLGAVLTGSFDGRFGSFTIDAHTGEVVDAFYADAPMNGSVVELPAIASEIGVTAAHPRFDYSVTGFSVLDGAVADPTGTASFDAFHPTASSGAFATVPAGGSATVPLTIDRSAQQSRKDALGWLVVSVDDAGGAAQADEVRAPTSLGR
jgi:subtilisin family serine protease